MQQTTTQTTASSSAATTEHQFMRGFNLPPPSMRGAQNVNAIKLVPKQAPVATGLPDLSLSTMGPEDRELAERLLRLKRDRGVWLMILLNHDCR